MKRSIGILHRLLDFISPRACVICGCRLGITEEVICATCNMHLPRTYYDKNPYENEMARLFWGQMPVERAFAMIYYEPHSQVSRMVHSLKYLGHPEVGDFMGRMMSAELLGGTFFDGIDMIVPVPLSRKRQRKRGYNQSIEIARGISSLTGIPVADKIVKREKFVESQTQKHRWQRLENVDGVFRLCDNPSVDGKHILLVDDVVTTGSTIISCANEISRGGNVRFSVLSFGYAKG